MRYYGQNWELEVPIPGGPISGDTIESARTAFDAEHDRQFGWSFPESAFELVNFRVVAVAVRRTVEMPEVATGALPEPVKRAPVYFSEVDGHADTRSTAGMIYVPGTSSQAPRSSSRTMRPHWCRLAGRRAWSRTAAS